jgi:formylglycine-generating enzyme required for sulfatase activity
MTQGIMNRSKQRKRVVVGLLLLILSLAAILLPREKNRNYAPSPLPQPSRTGIISPEHLFYNVIQLTVSFSKGEPFSGFGFIVAERDNTLYAVTANHLTFSDQPDIETTGISVQFYNMKGKFCPAKLSDYYDEDRDLTIFEVPKPTADYQWERNVFRPWPKEKEKVWFIGRDKDWFVPDTPGIVVSPPSRAEHIFAVNIDGIHPGTAGAPLITEKGIAGMIVADSPTDIKALDIDIIRILVSQEWGYPWDLQDTETRRKPVPDYPEPKNGENFTEPFTGMEFVWIPGGCYEMGCGHLTSECSASESFVHEVCIAGFLMGKYEVTQGQWKKIMGDNCAMFQKGDDYPTDAVSWYDAKEFIARLNEKSGANFRLPTEAEWEYACRSLGKSEKYAGGSDPDQSAWYLSDSKGSSHPAGTKSPNGSGLYDMSGNLWEWCEDIFHENAYIRHPRDNPIYLNQGTERVVRGGSWRSRAEDVRCACRYSLRPVVRYNHAGFRLVKQ